MNAKEEKMIERQKRQEQEQLLIKKGLEQIADISLNHRIVNKSSAKLDLEDNSVDLVVTSPPYYNAREYAHWDNIESYLKDMKPILKECFRTLKPGRKFCLNISDIPIKGASGVCWLPLGAYWLSLAEQVGFELADRIFWFKTPIKGFQYGSLPFPPSPLICDSMEYVYVLRKPGKADYTYVEKSFKEASRLPRSEYAEFTKQVWSIPRVKLTSNINGHIAPFPQELPFRCIKMYSFVGDVILDPFAGSGTTAIAAMDTRRNSVMYETKKEYAEMIYNRLKNAKSLFCKDKIKRV